ncbi:2-C-methyl-D-erythritol 2,4-cyclodiphosphate synthase [Alkalibacter saccharofermentans]|uniref:2-C-methyl-D-erythritol 2,4-cyclodiphosphate synthase n=1 Tax=Alkalibacter saccharofermentans DSM 14828 TaxID=1120975 RepID=A0A1M4X2D4_9FIRM|nr:2-C-methyl-D-erythritol 2,4-cyclodiphosphate synthase [Alkalibacter saccharofermentans]SHE87654.1 2-C-methyl-D-erythritol 2,4-cyclodiphosphate synthase [Alkalibacter saccharofermentans DSM 14828]
MRIGHGYDVHRLIKGRKLILGGVDVPHEKGLLGHSDADVLVHAIMDSILGALGKGDIGKAFPDTDQAYAGIDSLILLSRVYGVLEETGYKIGNIDATVIAQKPKLAPYIPDMRRKIADVLRTERENINIKATTEEKLGLTGREEGISAHSVVLLVTKKDERK